MAQARVVCSGVDVLEAGASACSKARAAWTYCVGRSVGSSLKSHAANHAASYSSVRLRREVLKSRVNNTLPILPGYAK